jgi:hypothetical protein
MKRRYRELEDEVNSNVDKYLKSESELRKNHQQVEEELKKVQSELDEQLKRRDREFSNKLDKVPLLVSISYT